MPMMSSIIIPDVKLQIGGLNINLCFILMTFTPSRDKSVYR